jgi:hypothetical protein
MVCSVGSRFGLLRYGEYGKVDTEDLYRFDYVSGNW